MAVLVSGLWTLEWLNDDLWALSCRRKRMKTARNTKATAAAAAAAAMAAATSLVGAAFGLDEFGTESEEILAGKEAKEAAEGGGGEER